MAYKDIVVHLGKDNRSAARLNAAIQLAEQPPRLRACAVR